MAAFVSRAAVVGVTPKSSVPLPLSAKRSPETAVSSEVVNASSTASGVAITVTETEAVLDTPLASVMV